MCIHGVDYSQIRREQRQKKVFHNLLLWYWHHTERNFQEYQTRQEYLSVSDFLFFVKNTGIRDKAFLLRLFTIRYYRLVIYFIYHWNMLTWWCSGEWQQDQVMTEKNDMIHCIRREREREGKQFFQWFWVHWFLDREKIIYDRWSLLVWLWLWYSHRDLVWVFLWRTYVF